MFLREKMWVKVWVNQATHTLTHYGIGQKSTGQDVPGVFQLVLLTSPAP